VRQRGKIRSGAWHYIGNDHDLFLLRTRAAPSSLPPAGHCPQRSEAAHAPGRSFGDR
jgi:hypothetical protein